MRNPLTVALLIIFCGVLFGCATPEPKIVTQTVKVAVPTPCTPNLGMRPALMTKDQIKAALDAAPGLDDRVKILTTQVLLYVGWVPVLEAGLNGCKGTPTK